MLALFAIVVRSDRVAGSSRSSRSRSLLQAVLTTGVGLIVAPLVVFFRDLERAVKLVLRFLFYASPIIYGVNDLPERPPVLGGVQPARRASSASTVPAFFPERARLVRRRHRRPRMSLALLAIGLCVFRAAERQVLKEI